MQKFISLSSLLLCATFCFAQSGGLDPTFGNRGITKTDMGSPFNNNSIGRQVLVQPGGSIYIIFNYPTFISKRFPNGSVDSSYGLNGYSVPVAFNDAYGALQPDGKIVLAGTGFNVARINANGMPDSSFGKNGMESGKFDVDSYASSVAVQNDGKIVVAGCGATNEGTYFAVARYNKNGNPDNTFNGNGRLLTDFGFKLPPEGGGSDSMPIQDSIPIHLQAATTIGIQADGKIVAGGHASNGANTYFAITRYNINGRLDSTFDGDGLQITSFGTTDNAYSLAIQSDGKIVLAGYTAVGSNDNFAVVRYKIDGSLDSSFNGNGKQTANLGYDQQIGNSLAIQSDGKLVIAGYTLSGDNNNDFALARFNTDGSLDKTFDNDGMVTTDFTSSDDYAGSVAIQDDNKILVAGYSYVYSPGLTVQHLAVSRYSPSGSLDNSFADNGKLQGDSKQGNTWFNATAVQPDGKIVAAGFTWNGSNYDFAVTRTNTDGSLDTTFGDDGKQTTDFGSTDEAVSIVIQPDGKIVVAGNSKARFAVARYNPNGSLDNSFNGSGMLISSMGFADNCESVALQSDGKIVLAGYTFIDPDFNAAYFAIARFNSDGTADNTFGDNGKNLTEFESSPSFATSMAIGNDGKIVVAGRAYINNQDNFSLMRLNTNGTADTTFSHDGKQNNVFGADDYFIQSLAIQNDGKIVVGGFNETASGNSSSFAVARYQRDGDLDNSFGENGFRTTNAGADFNLGTSVAINNDGRIAIGGTNDNYTIVLYKSNGSPDSTFGTGGIQITGMGTGGSLIQSIAFAGNKLYAAGSGQFPSRLGVIARYLLTGEVLPVSLLDFTAALQNKSVLLKWGITTEKNLTKFVIERSADGNRFLPINSVPVTKIVIFKENYSIVDEQPLQGINFYRIKMLDADGKSTYSNIVAVKVNTGYHLQIFPNPAREILFVEASGNNENAIVRVVDGIGRKIKELKVYLNGQTSFSVDISNLSKGIYNLILYKKEKSEVQMFIKK